MTQAAVDARPIQIVLAGIPGFTADLVRCCVLDQEDMVIIGEVRDAQDLPALAQEQRIDVILTVSTPDGVPGSCRQLLFSETALPIIAIATDGRLDIYDCRVLREAAPDELLMEIRKLAERRAAPLDA